LLESVGLGRPDATIRRFKKRVVMAREREQAARRISERLSSLSRDATNAGLDTVAYLIDMAPIEADREFGYGEGRLA
jgi:hypothetical protein